MQAFTQGQSTVWTAFPGKDLNIFLVLLQTGISLLLLIHDVDNMHPLGR